MADPYFSNVSLLLHMDGSDGSTTFTDVIGNTMTRVGSPVIATAQSVFGGASGDFRNASWGLTTPGSAAFDPGTGDFTFECWLYAGSFSNFEHILDTGSQRIACCFNSSGTGLNLYLNGGLIIAGSAHGMTAGNWYYLAWKRGSGTASIHIGTSGSTTQLGSASNSTNIGASTTVNIARYSGGSYGINTYLEEVRFTKGVARDVSTVPTSAFPDSGDPITYVHRIMGHRIPQLLVRN